MLARSPKYTSVSMEELHNIRLLHSSTSIELSLRDIKPNVSNIRRNLTDFYTLTCECSVHESLFKLRSLEPHLLPAILNNLFYNFWKFVDFLFIYRNYQIVTYVVMFIQRRKTSLLGSEQLLFMEGVYTVVFYCA